MTTASLISGAFGTVDFDKYSGSFNKRLYKADKLKERLKDKSIMFEIISERLESIEKYTVLKLLKAGTIELEHIADSDMYDLATVYLQICRLSSEIIELKKRALGQEGGFRTDGLTCLWASWPHSVSFR